MIITKIDSEELINTMKSFNNMYGRKPYIICNEETKTNIMACAQSCGTIGGWVITKDCSISTEPAKSIKIGDLEYVLKEERHPSVWNGSKILIDPDLKYGEVYIG